MKQIIVAGIALLSFTACNDQKSTDIVQTTDTTTAVVSDNYNTSNAYVPADGDVTYRNGKVMVWRNNAYVETDNDVEMGDSIVVYRNGEVVRRDYVRKMEEGESVSKTGRFFNKAGEGIEDAWDATKKGVSKAAQAVKKAGKKVGEGVKDAVD